MFILCSCVLSTMVEDLNPFGIFAKENVILVNYANVIVPPLLGP